MGEMKQDAIPKEQRLKMLRRSKKAAWYFIWDGLGLNLDSKFNKSKGFCQAFYKGFPVN
jgi:hypothetical protein